MTYTSQVETSFSGISDLTSNPPHNALAAGPTYIVTSEGARIEWTDLSGGSGVLQSIYQFFSPLGPTATNALFDPRAVYDPVNGRYVVTVDNIGANGTISDIDVAVSKDSNPNDGWSFVSLNTSLTINGQLTASDQPTVSVDGTNVYITAPQYYVNGGYAGTEVWVISDTAGSGGGVYNGGTPTVVASELTSSAQGIYRVAAGGNGYTYYADAYSSGSQTIVNMQAYSLATNTFGPTATLGLGNSDQGNGGSDFTAQQQGTNLLLDAGDSSLQSVVYANGFLYGVSEVQPAGSSVPLVHWFQIDVSNPANPTLVAQGDISGAALGSNVATFDASIAVDGAGDVIINFAASGPNMYPSDYYVYRGGTDPLNAFSAPILYQASTGYFNSGDGAAVQRWGANSSTTVDATDPHAFWLSGEYVANGWWQTSVAKIAIQTPADAKTDEDTPVSGSLAPLVSAGSTFTPGAFTSQDGAAVTIAADGSFTYDPTGAASFETTRVGQTVVDRFLYTSTDTTGVTTTGTMMVDVGVVDSGPVTANFDASAQVVTAFSGISNTENYPPENGLAVGQSYIVSAEGSRIEWSNLAGNAAAVQSIYQFFGSLGATLTNSLFDARAVYDSVNQRFVVTADNLGSAGSGVSDIDVAVSKDSNPGDGWYFAALDTALTLNGQLTSSDQPFVSADGTNIYITAPQYNVNAPGYAGTENWIIGDTAGSGGGIYNGGALTVVASEDTSPSQAVFAAVPGNNGETYYADAYASAGQTIVNVQAFNLATDTFGPTTTLALGNSDQGGGGSDFTAQQLGTTLLLDAGNARIQNLAYANGLLYGVSEVMPVGSSVPLVHWFEIDVSNPSSPKLVAQGDISGAAIGGNVATFDASIAVDRAGDVIINFTASSPNMYPADYYVFRGATDPPGTFSAPVLYQASTGFFNSGNGTTVQRWGDNSSAIADPNNSHTFWLSGEYVANNWWQTSVAQVTINTPLATSTAANTPLSGNLASLITAAEPTDSGDTLSFIAGTFTSVDGAKVTINSNGSYTYDPTGVAAFQSLIAGQTATDGFTYTVTDNHGARAAGTLTVGVTPRALPAVPTIADASDISGYVNAANDTAAQALTGTAGAGDTTNVYLNGATIPAYTVQANASGVWSQTVGVLADGSYSYTATATDAAGNVSAPSSPLAFTVDTVVPPAPTTADAADVNGYVNSANDTSAQALTGTVETGDTIAIYLNGATTPAYTAQADAAGNWSQTIGALADGTYSYTATATDAAGNVSAPSAPLAFTVVTSAPAPTVADTSDIKGYVNAANDTSAQALTGTAGAGDTIAIYLNGATTPAYTTQANAGGTWSQTIGVLADGTYSYAATATDAAGNVSAPSAPLAFTVDTTVPVAPTIADAADINGYVNAANDTSAQALSGTTDAGDTIAIYLNGATTAAFTTQADASGNWSQTIGALANGTYSYAATATDAAGNVSAPSAPLAFTVDTTAPAISSIAASGVGITNGNGDLDAGHIVTLTVSFTETVNVNTAGGSPTLALNDGGVAIYAGGSGTNTLTFSYTVLSGQNTADLTVSSFKLNGATIVDSIGNAANLAGATNDNPSGTLQIDTSPPTITIATIASNNIINATKAANGFKISGSTSGTENGQTVTVQIINSSNVVVDSYTAADQNNAWSVGVTSAQATALADGSYSVTANVSDKAGNPAPQASRALTVDEDKSPETPALTTGSSLLTVAAGGSVPLGITATPVDADDRLSVRIGGVPSYETITAPSGDSVSRQLQANGTYTWTVTEGSSATGTPITGLTLKSNYRGTGHPTATFTVTASNITSGETATSPAQTISVTDPPQIATSPPARFNPFTTAANTASNAALDHLAALFDQFVAAGFHQRDQHGAGSITAPVPPGGIDELTFLTHPHH